MNKYKIVGLINLLIATVQGIVLAFSVVLVPRLYSQTKDLRESFDIEGNINYVPTILLFTFLIALFVSTVYFGYNLFKGNPKYYTHGIVTIAVSILSVFVIQSWMVYAIILPIYQLTASF